MTWDVLLFCLIKHVVCLDRRAMLTTDIHTLCDLKDNITFTTLCANSPEDKMMTFFLSRLSFDMSCKLWFGLLPRISIAYGPRQAKKCLWPCAKCSDSDSPHACAKSDLGICSPLIVSAVSNDCVTSPHQPGDTFSSRKHTYIIMLPLNPTFI